MGLMICSKKDDACPKGCVQSVPHVCNWDDGCVDDEPCHHKGTYAPCVPVDASASGGKP